MSKKKECEWNKNNFLARKSGGKNDNNCYKKDEDGELWLKDECTDCKFCKIDNLFVDAVCTAKGLCAHGVKTYFISKPKRR